MSLLLRRRVLVGASRSGVRPPPPPPPPPTPAPTNTVLPTLSFGSSVVGTTVTCSTGTWATGATAPTSFTYRFTRDGAYISAVLGISPDDSIAPGTLLYPDFSSGASNAYVTTTGDIGHVIRCEVTAHNATDQTSVLSSNATVPQPPVSQAAPTNTVLPTISGDVRVGHVQTCTTGTWATGATAPTSFWYRWRRDGVYVTQRSASNTYTPVLADLGHRVDCVVEADNATTFTTVPTSNSIIVEDFPHLVTAPTLSGANVVGQVLTCSSGTWVNDPAAPTSFLYRFLRDGTLVIRADSTDPTYTQVTADVGHTITARVTATNQYGWQSTPQTANSVVTQAATAVTIEKAQGRPAASSGDQSATYPPANAVDGNAATRWSSAFADNQWWQVDLGVQRLVSSVEIEWEAAYSPTYKIQTSLDGSSFTDRASVTITASGLKASSFAEITAQYVRVLCLTRTTIGGTLYGSSFFEARVYGSDDNGPPPPPPPAAPTNTAQPSISGGTSVGSTLTCSTGTWVADSTAPTSYTYSYRRDGVNITTPSATNTYVTVTADAGHQIDCEVVATNAAALSTTVLSLNKITVAGGSGTGATLLQVLQYDRVGMGGTAVTSEVLPLGATVPGTSSPFDWAQHPVHLGRNPWRGGADRFMNNWGQLYEQNAGGGNPSGCKVELANNQCFVIYDDGTWWQIAHSLLVDNGSLYFADFHNQIGGGSGSISPQQRTNSATGTKIALPNPADPVHGSRNYHFFGPGPNIQNGPRPFSQIAGVCSMVRCRLDPATPNLHSTARYVLDVGVDAWRNGFGSGDYDGDAGIGRFKKVDSNWRLYTCPSFSLSGNMIANMPQPTGVLSTSEYR